MTENRIGDIPIISEETKEQIGFLRDYNSGAHYYDVLTSIKYSDSTEDVKEQMRLDFIAQYSQIYDYEAKIVVFSISMYIKYKKTVFDLADGGRRAKKDMVGTYACRTCKKKKTASRAVQVRGADEPMTVFLVCHNSDCKANGRTITFSEA